MGSCGTVDAVPQDHSMAMDAGGMPSSIVCILHCGSGSGRPWPRENAAAWSSAPEFSEAGDFFYAFDFRQKKPQHEAGAQV